MVKSLLFFSPNLEFRVGGGMVSSHYLKKKHCTVVTLGNVDPFRWWLHLIYLGLYWSNILGICFFYFDGIGFIVWIESCLQIFLISDNLHLLSWTSQLKFFRTCNLTENVFHQCAILIVDFKNIQNINHKIQHEQLCPSLIYMSSPF